MECLGTELMQIIQIISSVSSSEHIYFVLKTVCSVHIARSRWLPCELIVQPLKLFEVQNVHVISCERTLSQPATDDIEFIIHEGGSVPISSLWWNTTRFDLSKPAVSLCIKNSQITMILLSIIATKNVKLFIEQSRCVVLYLGCLNILIALIILLIDIILLRQVV